MLNFLIIVGVLVWTMSSILLGVTIFGVRIVIELIVDGIPEMDDDGNYVVEEENHPTAPWI
jgi:Zn-dependent membrane protease YugP